MAKNTVNAILENLRLNETNSIDLGNGATAYQYGGSYYIKKGDEKREISSDQYQKLINKGTGQKDTSDTNNKKFKLSHDLNDGKWYMVSGDTKIPKDQYFEEKAKKLGLEDKEGYIGLGEPGFSIYKENGKYYKTYQGYDETSGEIVIDEISKSEYDATKERDDEQRALKQRKAAEHNPNRNKRTDYNPDHYKNAGPGYKDIVPQKRKSYNSDRYKNAGPGFNPYRDL